MSSDLHCAFDAAAVIDYLNLHKQNHNSSCSQGEGLFEGLYWAGIASTHHQNSDSLYFDQERGDVDSDFNKYETEYKALRDRQHEEIMSLLREFIKQQSTAAATIASTTAPPTFATTTPTTAPPTFATTTPVYAPPSFATTTPAVAPPTLAITAPVVGPPNLATTAPTVAPLTPATTVPPTQNPSFLPSSVPTQPSPNPKHSPPPLPPLKPNPSPPPPPKPNPSSPPPSPKPNPTSLPPPLNSNPSSLPPLLNGIRSIHRMGITFVKTSTRTIDRIGQTAAGIPVSRTVEKEAGAICYYTRAYQTRTDGARKEALIVQVCNRF